MEIKKSKHANLETQRPTLLLLGLIISFGVTLQSFEWLKSDLVIKPLSALEDENLFEPIYEITVVKPQPKRQVASNQPIRAKKGPVLVIDEPIAKPVADPTPEPKPNPTPTTIKPIGGFENNSTLPSDGDELITTPEKTEFPYFKVEQKPEFIGGHKAMMQFIGKNIKYPEYCKANGIQGRVYISFIINKKGEITNVEIAKGKHKHLDKEAARVIKKMPKWKPGMQRGKAVKVKYTIPVNYQLKG